jgi:hypothetical protein
MSSTIEFKNYSITTSLNERSIYIKCIDTINFTNYEGNIDAKELRLQFELPDIYNLIIKCFKNEQEFTVQFNVTATNLKLTFNTKIGGFLKVNFEAILREKILSNDGQLTMNLNKIEQKYESLIKKLEALDNKMEKQQQENMRLINALSNADICLAQDSCLTHKIHKKHLLPINSTLIDIDWNIQTNSAHAYNFNKIELLYNLETIKFSYFRHSELSFFKNTTLKEIEIRCNNEQHLKSINGINNFPNLEKISVYSSPCLTNIVTILSSYKNNIKTLVFNGCPQINVVELQTYCQVNNVILNIS